MNLFTLKPRAYFLALSREDALERIRQHAQALRDRFPKRGLFSFSSVGDPVILIPYSDGFDLLYIPWDNQPVHWLRCVVDAVSYRQSRVRVEEVERTRPEKVMLFMLPLFLVFFSVITFTGQNSPHPVPAFLPLFPLAIFSVLLGVFWVQGRRRREALLRAMQDALPGLQEETA
jgi:hypothetical protein